LARKLIVELIADPRGYTKGLQTAATQTKVFGAEVDKATRGLGHATRGLVSGSGALHGFGRSLAFASGGFLAFEGVSKFLEDSVSSARDAGVAQRSLAAQMKASGESFTASRDAIEKASLSVEKFGFTSEDSEKALTVLERGTGNVARAISLQGVAANLARAKNLTLADAANVLAKVFGGQETALRRAVPGLAKHEHGLQLIADAEKRLAGQARAGTTDAERFHAVLHNTEVIIGSALLPTLNRFLGSLEKWLRKMNESGQLQKDVNRWVADGNTLFGDLKAAIDKVVGALGGWKQALTILVGAWAGFKAAAIADAVAVSTANVIAAGITEDAWKAALISTGWGAFAVAAGVAAAEVITHWQKVKDFFASFWIWMEETEDKTLLAMVEAFSHLPKILGGGPFQRAKAALQADLQALDAQAAQLAQHTSSAQAAVTKVKAAAGGGATPALPPVLPDVVSGGRPGASVSQRNTWFDNMINRQIGRVQDIPGLKGQVARLREIAGLIQQRLAATKDITRQFNLEDQLLGVQRTIRGDQAQIAQNRKDAEKAAADRRAAAQQAVADRLQFNVDRTQLTKGLQDDLSALQAQKAGIEKQIAVDGATLQRQQDLLNVELAINAKQQEIADARQARIDAAKQAKADAAQSKLDWAQLAIDRAGLTDSLTDDLKAARGYLALVNQQIKVFGKTLTLEQDRVNALKSIKDLKQQQADEAKKAADATDNASQNTRTLFQRLSASSFVNRFGAGLSGAQKRRLEVGFAMTGPGGTLPAGHSGQFTAGVTIHGGVHMHGVQDVAGLENQLAKRAKARPAIRRGTRG
jgi:murein DD-endopeptidase MepM/ murein hydrolase activator NlpD